MQNNHWWGTQSKVPENWKKITPFWIPVHIACQVTVEGNELCYNSYVWNRVEILEVYHDIGEDFICSSILQHMHVSETGQ